MAIVAIFYVKVFAQRFCKHNFFGKQICFMEFLIGKAQLRHIEQSKNKIYAGNNAQNWKHEG